MTTTVRLITAIGFTFASDSDVKRGLLGYVTCTFAGILLLDGLTLRRTENGRHALSFPSRTDAAGRRHAYYRPQDDRARLLIEDAVFLALGIDRQPHEPAAGDRERGEAMP